MYVVFKANSVSTEKWYCGVLLRLYEQHMVQLIPLPPHHLCFSKIQNGLSFWYQLTWTKGRKTVVVVVVVPEWDDTRRINHSGFSEAEVIGWQWHQLDHRHVNCISESHSTHIPCQPTLHHSSFYGPHALPVTQPTAPKHWREIGCDPSSSKKTVSYLHCMSSPNKNNIKVLNKLLLAT